MTVSKDDTIILDGAGDKNAIEERCDEVDNNSFLETCFPFSKSATKSTLNL